MAVRGRAGAFMFCVLSPRSRAPGHVEGRVSYDEPNLEPAKPGASALVDGLTFNRLGLAAKVDEKHGRGQQVLAGKGRAAIPPSLPSSRGVGGAKSGAKIGRIRPPEHLKRVSGRKYCNLVQSMSSFLI